MLLPLVNRSSGGGTTPLPEIVYFVESGKANFNLSFVNAVKAIQIADCIDLAAPNYSYSNDTFYTGPCNKMYITAANGGSTRRYVGYSLLTSIGTFVPCYDSSSTDIKTFSCSIPTDTYIKLALQTGGNAYDVYVYSWFLTKE